MTGQPIIVPRLGVSVTEVTLLAWTAEPGSPVTQGDVIAQIETDKVETELEAPASGTLHPIAEIGEIYPVGAVIGEIRAG